MSKLGLEKAEEPKIKLPTFARIIDKAREFQKSICFIDYAKAFDFVDRKNLWKSLKEMGIPDHLTCLWKTYMQVKQQQLQPYMEQLTGSKLWKDYVMAVYCHPVYLMYIQSTSYKMLGWMNHKFESRLPGEILTASDMQMISR